MTHSSRPARTASCTCTASWTAPPTSSQATPTWSSAWTSSDRSTCNHTPADSGPARPAAGRCLDVVAGRPTPARHGVRHLLAAYDLNRDRLYGHIKPRKRRGEFLGFLRYLRTLYPPGVRLAIVL